MVKPFPSRGGDSGDRDSGIIWDRSEPVRRLILRAAHAVRAIPFGVASRASCRACCRARRKRATTCREHLRVHVAVPVVHHNTSTHK
jgi:hypothetical protein